MAKKKRNTGLPDDLGSVAFNKDAAAKKQGNVPLGNSTGVIETLVNAWQSAQAIAREAEARLNHAIAMVGKDLGLNPGEWTLDWNLRAFIPKSDAAPAADSDKKGAKKPI